MKVEPKANKLAAGEVVEEEEKIGNKLERETTLREWEEDDPSKKREWERRGRRMVHGEGTSRRGRYHDGYSAVGIVRFVGWVGAWEELSCDGVEGGAESRAVGDRGGGNYMSISIQDPNLKDVGSAKITL